MHLRISKFVVYDLLIIIMLLICSLTFYSLGSSQITAEGAHAVAAALQVNQSLQELKLVGPLLSYFLRGLH